MSARRAVDLVLAGALWGAAGYLLAGRAFGAAIWPGVLAAPVIGVVVGVPLQRAFERASASRRRMTALLTLYSSATLFGLAIGVGALLGLSPGSRSFPAALVQPIVSVWWGVTFTGFFLALWPLAYLTHWWLEWRGVS